MEPTAEMAEEYPDVYFSHGTGYMSNGRNFNNYFGRIYPVSYTHLDVYKRQGAGQFEHTLIIVDKGAYLHFIEGCSAPKYNVANLHAGCVELFVEEGATLRYSTIENLSLIHI